MARSTMFFQRMLASPFIVLTIMHVVLAIVLFGRAQILLGKLLL